MYTYQPVPCPDDRKVSCTCCKLATVLVTCNAARNDRPILSTSMQVWAEQMSPMCFVCLCLQGINCPRKDSCQFTVRGLIASSMCTSSSRHLCLLSSSSSRWQPGHAAIVGSYSTCCIISCAAKLLSFPGKPSCFVFVSMCLSS